MDGRHLSVLTFVTLCYMLIGMLIFRKLELDNEKTARIRLAEVFNNFLGNHTCVNLTHVGNLLKSIRQEEFRMAQMVASSPTSSWTYRWDYAGAFSFVVTLVTTIGYGHLAPKTEMGKIVSVLYALVGIPLTLLMLKGIGKQLSSMGLCITRFQYCKTAWINNSINNFIVLVVGLNVIVLLPAVLLHFVERWTMIESLYFCFITLSTVGFGDYLPNVQSVSPAIAERAYRIFLYVWIFLGLAYVSLAITIISETIAEQARSVEKQALGKLESELHRLRTEVKKFRKHSTNITSKQKLTDSKRRLVDGVTPIRYDCKMSNDAFVFEPETISTDM